jgi:Tfp pilus assembly protein PilZ
MSLEVRYVKRNEPRVRTHRTKAGVAPRKLRIFKAGAHSASVLDLSASGMKFMVKDTPLEKGDHIVLELLHPGFRGAVQLDGVVRWVRSEPRGSAQNAVGVEFTELTERTRRQLDRVLALEVGSLVIVAGHGHVGFVARGSAEMEGTLFIYDLERHEAARAVAAKASPWQATRTRGGQVEQKNGDLSQVLRWVFGLSEGTVDVQPPL